MMKKAVATMLLLVNLVSHADAQQFSGARLEASKPTIYITFERFGEGGSVWLRLHNNSPWAISLRTENPYTGADVAPLTLGDGRQVSGVADGLEVAPEYLIEHATERITSSGRHWCTASVSWLASGRSVVFSFSRKELKEWEQLYVRFAYEWEGGQDPEHRVKYYGSELQKAH